jgi:hypothetical protein
MLQSVLRLRYVILLGSVAAGIGALLMFYEAGVKLAAGMRMLFVADASSGKASLPRSWVPRMPACSGSSSRSLPMQSPSAS